MSAGSQPATRAVDTGRHRLLGPQVVVSGLVLQVACGLAMSWGALVPDLVADGWSPVLARAVFSATPVGFGLGTILAGRLADHVPARRLCVIGISGMAVAMGIGLALATPLGLIFVFSFIGLGLAGAFTMAGSVAAGARAYPGHVGSIGGAMSAAYALNGPLLIPVLNFLSTRYGWLTALRLVCLGLVALGLLAVLAMPGQAAPRTAGRRPGSNPLAVLRRPPLYLALLAEALISPAGANALIGIPAYLRTIGFGVAVAATVVVAVAIGNTGGRVLAGIACDRFGSNRVYASTTAGLALAILVIAAAPGAATMLAAGLLAGFGFGASAGVTSRIGAEASPEAPNAGFGWMYAGFAFGAAIGPPSAALLGAGRNAWLSLAALAVLGIGVVLVRARVMRPVR